MTTKRFSDHFNMAEFTSAVLCILSCHKHYRRSVQLLETDRLLWLVLNYGTVCHLISLHATRCHNSTEKSNHFYLDSLIPPFCF